MCANTLFVFVCVSQHIFLLYKNVLTESLVCHLCGGITLFFINKIKILAPRDVAVCSNIRPNFSFLFLFQTYIKTHGSTLFDPNRHKNITKKTDKKKIPIVTLSGISILSYVIISFSNIIFIHSTLSSSIIPRKKFIDCFKIKNVELRGLMFYGT